MAKASFLNNNNPQTTSSRHLSHFLDETNLTNKENTCSLRKIPNKNLEGKESVLSTFWLQNYLSKFRIFYNI